jgi:hypothetical protein
MQRQRCSILIPWWRRRCWRATTTKISNRKQLFIKDPLLSRYLLPHSWPIANLLIKQMLDSPFLKKQSIFQLENEHCANIELTPRQICNGSCCTRDRDIQPCPKLENCEALPPPTLCRPSRGFKTLLCVLLLLTQLTLALKASALPP